MLWFIIIGGYFIGFILCFCLLYKNLFKWELDIFEDIEGEYTFCFTLSILFWWLILPIIIICVPFWLVNKGFKYIVDFLDNLPDRIKKSGKYKDIKFYKEK